MSVVVGSAAREDLPEILLLLGASGDSRRTASKTISGARSSRGRSAGAWAAPRSSCMVPMPSCAPSPWMEVTAGVGSGGARRALELARSRGASEAVLLTETADAFFARLGFGPVGRPAVPEPVRGSVEFVSACPASARTMSAGLREAGCR